MRSRCWRIGACRTGWPRRGQRTASAALEGARSSVAERGVSRARVWRCDEFRYGVMASDAYRGSSRDMLMVSREVRREEVVSVTRRAEAGRVKTASRVLGRVWLLTRLAWPTRRLGRLLRLRTPTGFNNLFYITDSIPVSFSSGLRRHAWFASWISTYIVDDNIGNYEGCNERRGPHVSRIFMPA